MPSRLRVSSQKPSDTYREALRIQPDFARAGKNLAHALAANRHNDAASAVQGAGN